MCSLYCKCRKSAIAARERQAAAHISAQPAASVEGRAGRVQARKLARSEVAQDLATWQKLQVEFGPILDTLSPHSPAKLLAQAPNSCSASLDTRPHLHIKRCFMLPCINQAGLFGA